MTKKPIKSESHHWWPRTLARQWADPDGMVSIIRPNGLVTRAPPGTFGAITNAHHIKLGGPWDSSFESIFNEPDSEMLEFVSWLFTLDAPGGGRDLPVLERIQSQPLPKDRQNQIARIVASLLARSPRIRHVIQLTTEHYRNEFGLAEPKADKSLIAGNQRYLYDGYLRCMGDRGRWAVLFSDSREFIAGDGFFHNFPASAGSINSGVKLALPILPTVTIVYMLAKSYPTEPKLVTIRVDDCEANLLNDIVQVYSRDILHFRTDKPILTEAFRATEYRQFKYDQHDWLDGLLDDLSQYNHWGKGGSPATSGRRPYSQSIEDSRMFDRFVQKLDI